MDITLFNEPGQPPWVPREVTLKGVSTGVLLKVRAVEVETGQLPPGAMGRVLVEAEPPTSEAVFLLEVKDAAGRGFTIPKVNLSSKESKR